MNDDDLIGRVAAAWFLTGWLVGLFFGLAIGYLLAR